MTLAVSQGKMYVQEFVWDISGTDLGTQAAQALSGPDGANLPLGAVVTGVKGLCETVVVGASATVALGTSASAACFMAATAITALDTIGKVIGQAVIPTTAVQALTATTRDVKMTIATANLTGGKIRFMISYYVPVEYVQTN